MSGALRLAVCRGIDATRPDSRLGVDPKTGEYHVPMAVNVDVGPSGEVSRRPGFRRVAAGDFHSLWSDGREAAYAGCGDSLVRIVPDVHDPAGVVVETVASGLTPGAPVCFLGVAGRVYFANGFETGVIAHGRAGPWGGAAAMFRPGDFVDPPAGHLLEYHAGRIFIASGETVFFTQGAGAFHLVDPAGGFLPVRGGRVRLLAAVDDGLFVGTDQEVFFAAGRDPREFAYRRVMDRPPLPGTGLCGPGPDLEAVAGGPIAGRAVVWADRRGVCLGLAGGQVERLVRLPLPDAGHGAALATEAGWLFVLSP
ncbi:hypothetical protein [Desulfolutivibrio sulfoxidireducens]|uniref:hypothetical protein n=1 Tax=Desulfolutivibrio sulfoxidireducens TaxID=2773299 RepID=UPI00159EAD37|nr:hypothetical protein [Desulfolutivibrio sulfoxidireducens]QLA21278.1 hypothetical protein GD604_16880 [Desulfolutivibrio sulfoxidireducens]